MVELLDYELILCNTRINAKMNVCYVLIDQDYFLLVQTVSDTKIKLFKKQHLSQLKL